MATVGIGSSIGAGSKRTYAGGAGAATGGALGAGTRGALAGGRLAGGGIAAGGVGAGGRISTVSDARWTSKTAGRVGGGSKGTVGGSYAPSGTREPAPRRLR